MAKPIRKPKKEYWQTAHRVAEPEVSTIACPSGPVPSQTAVFVARRMVGGLRAIDQERQTRVERLAQKLDNLVRADKATRVVITEANDVDEAQRAAG